MFDSYMVICPEQHGMTASIEVFILELRSDELEMDRSLRAQP